MQINVLYKKRMNYGGGFEIGMIVQRLSGQKQFQLKSDRRGDKSLLILFVGGLYRGGFSVKKMTQVGWICSWFPK